MSREHDARIQLKEAITDFEAGLSAAGSSPELSPVWGEYSVAVMRAAGALSEHRFTYELYRRWEQWHVTWENRYMAGVAAFNMSRYQQAIRLWSPLNELQPIIDDVLVVIDLMERGTIPPFTMEYDFVYSQSILDALVEVETSVEAHQRYMALGNVRMLMLLTSLSMQQDDRNSQTGIAMPVSGTGDWGRRLGFGLFEGTRVPMSAKVGAAFGLVRLGEYRPGQPIEMVTDGERRTVSVEMRRIDFKPGAAAINAVNMAQELSGRGENARAIDLLESYSAEAWSPPFRWRYPACTWRTVTWTQAGGSSRSWRTSSPTTLWCC